MRKVWRSLLGVALLAAGALFLAPSSSLAVIFPVTKTADTADGVCNADCSLREAIIAANAAGGPDTITLPAGTYVLTLAGPDGEDASANGDLDITSELTISGAGAATTIVDGNGTNRVFEVFVGPVSFSGLTIRNALAAGFGGGINNRSTSTVTITNSIISNNRASSFGGGINNNFSGTATVTGSTISNNTASDGGGINNNSTGSFTLTDSTVSGNTSTNTSFPGGGGVLNNSSGPMAITGSTISGNTSAGVGGGIANNSGGVLTVVNTTVSNNTSTSSNGGGGIYRNSIGAVSLTNVTVVGNSAPQQGGGLRNNRGDSPITLLRSIVANSVSGGNCSGVISSLGNNLSSDATCNLVAAGDLPNTNPQVAPLASNGGPTQTHALLAGSPAINAGGAGCPPPATDQRGVTRPQGAACEIGSFECQTGECAGIGATPTPTPTGAPPTATPTGVPPTLTPTSVPTAAGGPANVPTLSFPMLALLGLALAATAVFLLKR